MKKTKTAVALTLIALIAAVACAGPKPAAKPEATSHSPAHTEIMEKATPAEPLPSLQAPQWVVETNVTTYLDPSATNAAGLLGSRHVEVTVISSNRVCDLIYRDRTNRLYLESVTLTNYQRAFQFGREYLKQ